MESGPPTLTQINQLLVYTLHLHDTKIQCKYDACILHIIHLISLIRKDSLSLMRIVYFRGFSTPTIATLQYSLILHADDFLDLINILAGFSKDSAFERPIGKQLLLTVFFSEIPIRYNSLLAILCLWFLKFSRLRVDIEFDGGCASSR